MKVFKTDGPGLGDHLQFSTLPEMFFNEGEDFYLHRSLIFRNEEIKQLVWDLNPYVKGISDYTPNCGELKYCSGKEPVGRYSLTEVNEYYNNLKPTNKFPKIYYKHDRYEPNTFRDRIYIDMFSIGAIMQGSFAQKNTILNLQDFIKFTIKNNENRELFLIKNKHQYTGLDIGINLPVYEIKNIFEYCDLIKYCNTFITLFSGSMVLASAIKQYAEYPKIVTIDSSQHLRSNLENNSWYFENVQYVGV